MANKLREWLTANGKRQQAFAAEVATSQAEISRLCSGKKKPDIALAFKISAATGGEVAIASWLPQESE